MFPSYEFSIDVDDVINFLPRTQLSAEGIVLSAMIREKLKWVHSLKISEDFF